ncbi:N/A [soil metagenome]
MHQFILQQNTDDELKLFPHIVELGVVKNVSMRLNAFPKSIKESIRVYYIIDGKFEWTIQNKLYKLYPGDVMLVMPGQVFGNDEGVLEIGAFSWLHINMQQWEQDEMVQGKWSSLSRNEFFDINDILQSNNTPFISKFAEAGKLLKCVQRELFSKEIGYLASVNHHIYELFILIARQLSRQSNPGRDFPKTFMDLEQALRKDLSNQWTVEQMAVLVGMCPTLLNEKVKSFTGFSPITYLINIRISEATKLLKRPGISLTDIALDTGFYSSQHFSTTFKKLTGYTPSEFRKNHLP